MGSKKKKEIRFITKRNYISSYILQVFFHNPARMLRVVLIVQGLVVFFQLVILFCTYEWYQVLSLTISLVINYYPLFKVGRDWLITWKVYRAEEIIQEKSQMAVNHIAQ